jgi:hypothetical protein
MNVSDEIQEQVLDEASLAISRLRAIRKTQKREETADSQSPSETIRSQERPDRTQPEHLPDNDTSIKQVPPFARQREHGFTITATDKDFSIRENKGRSLRTDSDEGMVSKRRRLDKTQEGEQAHSYKPCENDANHHGYRDDT